MSIELIVLDVDGTMTDGKITYSESGDEVKSFCVKDGLAIASWLKLGKSVAIITGRKSKIVANRANELNITHLHQGVKNKLQVLKEILDKMGLSMEHVASIGDDLNDFQMLTSSKISFVPNNGSEYIKTIADIILSKNGGDGAVREMIEVLIEREGLREQYLKLWHYE
jgi:3-deoxy-D-manno-octulosonate 8-phosphate phosphatase (KDO 8-P phosphatase)